MPSQIKTLVWWWIGGAVILLFDRGLKSLALNNAAADLGLLNFHLVKNYGLVFSWPAPGWVIYGLLITAMVIVAGLIVRNIRRDPVVVGGASLMLAGAASNLFDRCVYGYVVDWFDIGRWWTVFNLADVMLTVGLITIIFRPSLTSRT